MKDDSRDRADNANKKNYPALETRQSHTIEYGVSKIVPEGHSEGNKSPAMLRGSAARERIIKYTDVQPEHCVYGPGRAPLRGCIGLHLILYSLHSTATDRRSALSHSNTPPFRNRAPLTARSSCLRCISAAEHHTVEQFSKTGRTKPRKHLSRSDLPWITRQDFLKIPSLWEAAI